MADVFSPDLRALLFALDKLLDQPQWSLRREGTAYSCAIGGMPPVITPDMTTAIEAALFRYSQQSQQEKASSNVRRIIEGPRVAQSDHDDGPH